MPVVQSFTCPHCTNPIARGMQLNFIAVPAPAAKDWAVYVLVCPHCNASLGPYATPTQ